MYAHILTLRLVAGERRAYLPVRLRSSVCKREHTAGD